MTLNEAKQLKPGDAILYYAPGGDTYPGIVKSSPASFRWESVNHRFHILYNGIGGDKTAWVACGNLERQ